MYVCRSFVVEDHWVFHGFPLVFRRIPARFLYGKIWSGATELRLDYLGCFWASQVQLQQCGIWDHLRQLEVASSRLLGSQAPLSHCLRSWLILLCLTLEHRNGLTWLVCVGVVACAFFPWAPRQPGLPAFACLNGLATASEFSGWSSLWRCGRAFMACLCTIWRLEHIGWYWHISAQIAYPILSHFPWLWHALTHSVIVKHSKTSSRTFKNIGHTIPGGLQWLHTHLWCAHWCQGHAPRQARVFSLS